MKIFCKNLKTKGWTFTGAGMKPDEVTLLEKFNLVGDVFRYLQPIRNKKKKKKKRREKMKGKKESVCVCVRFWVKHSCVYMGTQSPLARVKKKERSK